MSTDTPARSRWQTLPTLGVLGAGLLVVAFVWVLSCVWSFSEQTRAAGRLGFEHPAVLPYMLDALAGALALVALAAALAGQSAGLARLGVILALAGSVWANAVGVSLRLPAHDHALRDAIAMAAVAPLAEIVTLEVLLGRLRRLVLWLRGEEPPAAIPHLRLIRLVLNPKTFADWRKTVLDLTKPAAPGVPVSSPHLTDTSASLPGAAPTDPGTAAPATVPGSAPSGAPAGAHLTVVSGAPESAPRTRRVRAASAPGRTRVTAPVGAPEVGELARQLRALRVQTGEPLSTLRPVRKALHVGQDTAKRVLAVVDGDAGGDAS